jgi:hypothetical protein
MDAETKQCSRCKDIKPLGAFDKSSQLKSGRASKCKKCRGEVNAAWAAVNRDKVNASIRKWKLANPEYVRAENKGYKEREREKINERRRARRAANPEQCRLADLIYYHSNVERLREKDRRWRESNPDKMKAKSARTVQDLTPSYVASAARIPVLILKSDPMLLASVTEIYRVKRAIRNLS